MVLDSVPCDIAALTRLFEGDDEVLLMVSVAGCAPCIAMKTMVEEALWQHPSITRMRSLTFADATYRDPRITALLGRPLTMFPSLLFRTQGHHRWIRGTADKSGPFDAARLAHWFTRRYAAAGTDL